MGGRCRPSHRASLPRLNHTDGIFTCMRTRDNIGAVIKSLKRDHSLLAAYLEATEKIDWRAFDGPVLIGETTPKLVNVEAGQASPPPFVWACQPP